jgi:uncharacterized protein (DUF2164 family)
LAANASQLILDPMKLNLPDEDRAEVLASLRRYFRENLDRELSQLESNFLLEYIEREIAPFAYNQGARDARDYFVRAAEDVTGACFEEPLRFWSETKGSGVRRKPDR